MSGVNVFVLPFLRAAAEQSNHFAKGLRPSRSRYSLIVMAAIVTIERLRVCVNGCSPSATLAVKSPDRIEGVASDKREAQQRVDRIHSFRDQLAELERDDVLALSAEQRERLDGHLNGLLKQLA